jgi:hypothetical protein
MVLEIEHRVASLDRRDGTLQHLELCTFDVDLDQRDRQVGGQEVVESGSSNRQLLESCARCSADAEATQRRLGENMGERCRSLPVPECDVCDAHVGKAGADMRREGRERLERKMNSSGGNADHVRKQVASVSSGVDASAVAVQGGRKRTAKELRRYAVTANVWLHQFPRPTGRALDTKSRRNDPQSLAALATDGKHRVLSAL